MPIAPPNEVAATDEFAVLPIKKHLEAVPEDASTAPPWDEEDEAVAVEETVLLRNQVSVKVVAPEIAPPPALPVDEAELPCRVQLTRDDVPKIAPPAAPEPTAELFVKRQFISIEVPP